MEERGLKKIFFMLCSIGFYIISINQDRTMYISTTMLKIQGGLQPTQQNYLFKINHSISINKGHFLVGD